MAKYANGTNYAKSIDPSGANIVNPGILGGKVRVMEDYYTFGADSLNSSDYIIVGTKLPTGSQVVDIWLTAGSPLVTESATFVVGDEGDPNRYVTSTILTAGAMAIGINDASTGLQYTITGVTDNYIRVAGADDAAVVSGAAIKISIFYVVE